MPQWRSNKRLSSICLRVTDYLLHRLIQFKRLILPKVTILAGHSSSFSTFVTGSKEEPRTITFDPFASFSGVLDFNEATATAL